MLVYAIRNLVSGKQYVGQTCGFPEQRWRRHTNKLRTRTHENEKLQRAWDKYGEDAFEFYIVRVCSTRKELNTYEKHHIKTTDAIRNGYNIKEGGDACPIAESTKRKLSKIAKQQFESLSEEEKEARRKYIAEQGRNRSKEATQRMANTIRQKYKDPKYKEWWRQHQTFPWEGFVSPIGKRVTINDLPDFCRRNKLDLGCMVRVYYGERKSHNGWTHPSAPLREKRKRVER